MAKKKTHEEFVTEVFNKYKDEYSVIGQYLGAKEKIEIKHNTCGNIFKIAPSNLLSGQGCPPCKHKQSHQKQMFTNEKFDTIIFELVGNEYERISNYDGMYKRITLKHNVCNCEFDILPVDFIHKGIRCKNKICQHERLSIAMRDTKTQFQEKFEKRSNGEYQLLSDYHLSREKIKIKHLKCGNEFEMTPNSFLNGCGCPNCKGLKISNKLTSTVNTFIEKMKEIHGENITLYGDYKNMHTKANFICNNCGHIWCALPTNITHKSNPTGCPICKVSQGERRINQYFKLYNIENAKQVKFDSLIGIGNNCLSYDFYLPTYNILIEYQGRQHYEPVEAFGGQKYFDIQQEHDRRKRQYAKDHGIKLLEIAYWDFDNIEEILSRELGLTA